MSFEIHNRKFKLENNNRVIKLNKALVVSIKPEEEKQADH